MYFRVGCDVRTYIRSVNAFIHTVEHIVHMWHMFVCTDHSMDQVRRSGLLYIQRCT